MARVGRNREKHKRLPKGWAPSKSGTIYFRPTNAADKAIVKAITGGALSLRLGATHDEAAETFARQIVAARRREEVAQPGTVAEICLRARNDYLPTIENPKTLDERTRHVDELEHLFGSRRYARSVHDAARDAALLNAADIQGYLDGARETRPVAANRAIRTWELVWTWAKTRWRLVIDYNPCSGLFRNPEHARDVLPDDAAIFGKVYRRLDPPMRFAVAMIRFYGRRKGEILGLTLAGDKSDGLHLRRGKARGGAQGKELVLEWDVRLRKMWARLMRWRKKVVREGKLQTTMAILNRRGKCYTVTGFNSAWRRAMKRAGTVGEFTFHDIRATRASTLSPEKAVEVLAHENPSTTNRVYRRGPTHIRLAEDGIHEKRRELPKFPKEKSS